MRARQTSGRLKLAAFVAALATAAPAKASTIGFEGFDPLDPFFTTARELVRVARQKCNIGPRALRIGVASMPLDTMVLTKDQSHHVMHELHTAFSRLADISLVPFADVGAINEIKQIGMLSNPNAGNAAQEIAAADIVVRANVQRSGRNLRMSLNAVGVKVADCYEFTNPVEIQSAAAGETFITTDAIFNRAAMELWEKSRGTNQVLMTSVTDHNGNQVRPDNFVAQLRRSVSHTRQFATMNVGNPTELEVGQGAKGTPSSDTRWVGEVLIEQRQDGYRVNLDLLKTATTGIHSSGVVLPEDMPALRRSEMGNRASVIRNAPSQRGRNIEAAVLHFQAAPTRIVDAIDGEQREQRYAFNVRQESYVEFDVVLQRGQSRVFIVELYNGAGNTVQPMFEGKIRPNLRRYRLPPGAYETRVRTDAPGRHEFLVSSRAVDVGRMLTPEMPGKLTRQFQDWYAGETTRVGKKTCYVFTVATDVSPIGWREQRPIIFMSFEEGTGTPLNHLLDVVERYQPLSPQKAVFHGAAGVEPMEVRALKSNIQPIVISGSGEAVLNREAVKGYTRGTSIELSGTSPDGKATSVRYSLRGYRSAVNAAAINCGRNDLARDLVWQ